MTAPFRQQSRAARASTSRRNVGGSLGRRLAGLAAAAFVVVGSLGGLLVSAGPVAAVSLISTMEGADGTEITTDAPRVIFRQYLGASMTFRASVSFTEDAQSGTNYGSYALWWRCAGVNSGSSVAARLTSPQGHAVVTVTLDGFDGSLAGGICDLVMQVNARTTVNQVTVQLYSGVTTGSTNHLLLPTGSPGPVPSLGECWVPSPSGFDGPPAATDCIGASPSPSASPEPPGGVGCTYDSAAGSSLPYVKQGCWAEAPFTMVNGDKVVIDGGTFSGVGTGEDGAHGWDVVLKVVLGEAPVAGAIGECLVGGGTSHSAYCVGGWSHVAEGVGDCVTADHSVGAATGSCEGSSSVTMTAGNASVHVYVWVEAVMYGGDPMTLTGSLHLVLWPGGVEPSPSPSPSSAPLGECFYPVPSGFLGPPAPRACMPDEVAGSVGDGSGWANGVPGVDCDTVYVWNSLLPVCGSEGSGLYGQSQAGGYTPPGCVSPGPGDLNPLDYFGWIGCEVIGLPGKFIGDFGGLGPALDAVRTEVGARVPFCWLGEISAGMGGLLDPASASGTAVVLALDLPVPIVGSAGGHAVVTTQTTHTALPDVSGQMSGARTALGLFYQALGVLFGFRLINGWFSASSS